MSCRLDVGANAVHQRSYFFRALVVSLLAHGLVLGLAPGSLFPGKGVGHQGGFLQATLRTAVTHGDVSREESLSTEYSSQTASAVLVETADETKPAPLQSAPAQNSATPPPSLTGQAESGARVAGDGPLAGQQGLTGVIPILPPLSPMRPVTRRPSILAPLTFSYPPNVPLQGGRVRVRILLGERGEVEEMRVVDAVPAGMFDATALAVLRSARFGPGFLGAYTTRSYLFMELTFGPGPGGQQLLYAGSSVAPPVFHAPTPTEPSSGPGRIESK